METTSSKALKILDKDNSVPYKISPFMNHLVVEVEASDEDFQTLFMEIERTIRSSLEQNFKELDDNLLFDVRSKENQKSFKIYK